MTHFSVQIDPREIAADKEAVAAINFCSLWPTALPILQQLAAVISSSIVKFAINTVISAGNAYCGKAAASHLTKEGVLKQMQHSGIENLNDAADFVMTSLKSGDAPADAEYFCSPQMILIYK